MKKDLTVLLVGLYRHHNTAIRLLHAVAASVPGVRPHTVFFKECGVNRWQEPTIAEYRLFMQTVRELRPDLVAISVLTPYAFVARILSEKVREVSPETLVLWGGIHPTILPERAIEHADIICRGEGESAFADLLQALTEGREYHTIQNLWVRDGAHIIKNPLRPLLQQIDRLPVPATGSDAFTFIQADRLTHTDPWLYDESLWIQASRGCPYACTYCASSTLRPLYRGLGQFVRLSPVDAVLAEIREHRARAKVPVRLIFFFDEVFAVDPAWLAEFSAKYAREFRIPFHIQYHPTLVNAERITQLAAAGLQTIYVGIQSGSDTIRTQVFGRPEKRADIIALAKIAADAGVQVKYDLIMNNPYETPQTLRDGIELLLALPKPFAFHTFSLQFFPGYPLTERALREGLITAADISEDQLFRNTRSFVYVPTLFPATERRMLQNIIWLYASGFAANAAVRYATLTSTPVSRLCLWGLHLQSVIWGSLFGFGRCGFLLKLRRAVSLFFVGDLPSLGKKIRNAIIISTQ